MQLNKRQLIYYTKCWLKLPRVKSTEKDKATQSKHRYPTRSLNQILFLLGEDHQHLDGCTQSFQQY